MASNPGATDAAAQASALGMLAWISAAVTVVTLVVSLMLRKPVEKATESLAEIPAAATPPPCDGQSGDSVMSPVPRSRTGCGRRRPWCRQPGPSSA